MESENQGESFLKIDTIWSEAEEGFLVKEEIVSDFEPECSPSADESSDGEIEKRKSENNLNISELTKGNNPNEGVNVVEEKSVEKGKCEESENVKVECSHDAKNYKVVRRRLRCGECRCLVCPECYKVLASTFQTHLAGCDLNKIEFHSCKVCRLAFHSFCAFQAHVRIHTMTSPYVCPDCGLIYNNVNFLILHLIKKCCHVYKSVRYKCKCCPGAFFSPKMFMQHIQIQHIESRYRCSYCSSLFGSPEEFRLHMNKVHQNLKAQYISYFLCSLCSDMVISRFMYEKHIGQHCESYDSYQIDYQCVCGYMYNTVSVFRSHLQECSKKGVLPLQWAFLQKKLTNHEVIQSGSFRINDEILVHPVQSSVEHNMKPLNVFCSTRKLEKNENVELLKNEVCEKVVGDKNTEKSGKEENAEKFVQRPYFENTPCNEVDASQKHSLKPSLHDKAVEVPREPTKVKDPSDAQSKEGPKNSELYNHIPCDHLGYLSKTQTTDLIGKNASTSEANEETENKSSCEKFNTVYELDEKTGLMSSKKIPFEDSPENEKDKNENLLNDFDKGVCCNPESKIDSSFKNSRFGFQSFFTCPFCVVKFQKHKATFQQFRLHLESYHPDAALNIVFNDEETEEGNYEESIRLEPLKKTVNENLQITKVQTKLKDCYVVLGEKIKSPFSKNIPAANYASASLKPKEMLEKEKKGICCNQNNLLNIDNIDREKQKQKTKEISDKVKENVDVNEKLNLSSEPNRTSNDSNESRKNVCWTVEISLPNTKADISTSGKSTNTLTNKESDEKSSSLETKVQSSKPITPCQKVLKPNETNTFEPEVVEGLLKLTNKTTKVSETNNEGSECVEETEKNKQFDFLNGEEKPEAVSIFEAQHRKLIKIEVDLDDGLETTKNLTWNSDTFKVDESKIEEKEKTRRESEVWSEFYESLKTAEKLKKKKAKKVEDSREGRKSVVSDYSAKRVVKKPKRFRQSSESECSGLGCENSDSDRDNIISNYLTSKKSMENEEETCQSDVNHKRQTILSKLENIDDKFLDYLFHIISQKEKFMEFRNKNLNLGSISFSQELQTYRKKVLNGIKQRGRPHKMLRCEEILKKKSGLPLGGVSILKELPDRQKLCLSEVKSGERKRGRPRKVIDPSKIKERRRSNKEVDFIEKHFEREGSESSPSKRKRKLSSKLQYYKNVSAIDDKDDFSSGQVIANKSFEANKKFCCAFCKEVFSDILEFREHILGHRVEENSYQCMECGECFVVRPSLEKHLHAFHKIKNTDKYISENQCCNIKEETVEVDNEPLKENQCKVCKDQFDRAIDLTKHFRIHGMAFLKQFRKEAKSK